jgi:hypothetical protein
VPLVLWILTALCMAVMGPFGSYGTMTLGERLLFWAPVMAIVMVIVTAIRALVYGTLGLTGFRRGSLVVTMLICTVICPLACFVMEMLSEPGAPGMPSFWEMVLLVGSLSLGVCSLRLAVQAAPSPDAGISRLMQRMEPSARGDLVSISVRDHYVDVRTSHGQVSLLMRFGDAMAEAAPVDGVQVHRSHWVAWDAIAAVENAGGRMVLRLKRGETIPISRSHREKLQARGLL